MHLVLNSFGASLRRDNALFLVTTAEGKQHIHPRDVKSITISKAARISSDAVLMAIEHEIDVLFVDTMGTPKGRVWSIQYGSISDIRRAQIDFLYSDKALPWIRELLTEKINNQMALLKAMPTPAEDRAARLVRNAINSMEDHMTKIRAAEGEALSDLAPTLRGWEGAASRRYFEVLPQFLPEAYQFERRSHHPARDRFNCLLNYGYGILYGKVEGALIKAGIDPYTGIFHRDDYNRPALVFDVIEKFRIWVDYVVIHLCRQEAFDEDCFVLQEDEGIYLQGLGKRILIQSVNDYLAEVVRLQGLTRSRAEHIQRYAHRLAQAFLQAT
jgi:CRISPR-associated protein Cas1